MSMTDPVSYLLTRIRNAQKSRKETVEIPFSSLKEEVARILKEEGYVRDFKVQKEKDQPQGVLKVSLKYLDPFTPAISHLERVSKPGRRVYVGAKEIPRVLNGMGVAIVSTSQGMMTDRESRKRNLGGEVLCYVW